MAVMEYIDAIRLAMKEEMERDENVFILGEDVGLKGGVFTTTKGTARSVWRNASDGYTVV